jgi:hypothetical protein
MLSAKNATLAEAARIARTESKRNQLALEQAQRDSRKPMARQKVGTVTQGVHGSMCVNGVAIAPVNAVSVVLAGASCC